MMTSYDQKMQKNERKEREREKERKKDVVNRGVSTLSWYAFGHNIDGSIFPPQMMKIELWQVKKKQ